MPVQVNITNASMTECFLLPRKTTAYAIFKQTSCLKCHAKKNKSHGFEIKSQHLNLTCKSNSHLNLKINYTVNYASKYSSLNSINTVMVSPDNYLKTAFW